MKKIIFLIFIILNGCDPSWPEGPYSPCQNIAFILTSDFREGSFSTIEINNLITYKDLGLQQIHSDALVKDSPFDSNLYIINRQGRDNIQLINPYNNWQTEKEISTGQNSNPIDLVFTSSSRFYVARYNRSFLWEINLLTEEKISEIDLSPWANQANSGQNKNIPHMQSLYLDGNKYLFIALQRLQDNWHPSSYSSVLVFKTKDHSFIKEIKLEWYESGNLIRPTNPYTNLKFVSRDIWQPNPADNHDHLLVSCTGEFGNFQQLDGGIIAIDIQDQNCEPGFIIKEEEIQMEIIDFTVKSASNIYAVTSKLEGDQFISKLINYNPIPKNFTILKENKENLGQLVSLEIHSSGKLFLADQKITLPGIWVYDTNNNDQLLNQNPINVGLPPSNIIFYE
jgi:hypothetical protein